MNDEPTLFDAPDHAVARRHDPDTSWAAARSISTDKLRDSQQKVLDAFKAYGPMTDEQVAQRVAGQSPSGLRTRRSELVKAELLRDSGERATTASGRKTIVWTLT